MHFSVICGLCVVFVNALLYLPAQGRLQRDAHYPSFFLPVPSCCMEVSKARVPEPVVECYEQKENTIRYCKIHAYIFVSETRQYCVDPRARWLPKTLKKLEQMGINCTALVQTP